MPRDNRCVNMVHAGFYVCCSDCVGVCLLCSSIVEDIRVLSLGV